MRADRKGVRHSFSCLVLEIRLAAWRGAATRGRGTNWLYEPGGLEGLVAPTTGSRYVAPRATRSHTVVRYADLDLRRLNHSPSHATPLVYERIDRVAAIVEIVAYQRVHVSSKIRCSRLPLELPPTG